MSLTTIAGPGNANATALQRSLRTDERTRDDAASRNDRGVAGAGRSQFTLDTAALAAAQAQNSQQQTQTQNAVTAIQSGAYQVDLYL